MYENLIWTFKLKFRGEKQKKNNLNCSLKSGSVVKSGETEIVEDTRTGCVPRLAEIETSQTCYHSKGFPGAGIDLSSLVAVEGKFCWDLYIDGLDVSSDGNLLDALGAAIKACQKLNVAAGASGDEQPEVDVSDEEFLQFDTSRVPVIVTLTKVGRHYIVDATSEEESQMSSAVSISINRQRHIWWLTKRGGA
ncbi:exosome complex component RRP42 [Prunus yedoensis var. nudiflora]|uniref:Ribosomal RNA-processing protein 42 n=1 Tax=Prunus yedoensis var. nudiflora TaxID=2094558 RepID=A0A314ZRD2_PRUYE|nr:exosome complex component RRP42 [Prunus yedoensis var. nudiflora]